jgi:hypothetical protein
MDAEHVERIESEGKALALIIRRELDPEGTSFVTPSDFNFQVGFVVYPEGGTIAPHVHRAIERHIVGTPEVLVVRRGRCEIDIFDDARALVATRELRTGDVMLMIGGGHGFRMIEPTVLFEVKQGPYTGLSEKERF